MSSSYKNLDNEEATTSMYVPFASGLRFSDIAPDLAGDMIKMSYTRVICDLPYAVDDYGNVLSAYWNLTTSYTNFLLSRRFKPAVNFVRSTLKVYLKGQLLTDVTSEALPGNTYNGAYFNVPNTYGAGDDGIMYAEYVPALSSLFNGNNTTTMATTHKTIAVYVQEEVRIDNIMRARQILNNIESYFVKKGYDYPPTLWIGGHSNASKSGPTNIIPGHTPVYYAHLVEMQNAINRAEQFIASTLNTPMSESTFLPAITPSSTYMVNYMERIFLALYNVELKLLGI